MTTQTASIWCFFIFAVDGCASKVLLVNDKFGSLLFYEHPPVIPVF